MKPFIKFGLIAGSIGLVLNVCVSAAMGICGPFTSFLAGAAAGFLTAREEKAVTKGNGARSGAIAGAIAGALVLVGQLLGTVASLAFVQYSGLTPIVGSIPGLSADVSMQAIYYLSGLGTGLCFGMMGVVTAALSGAAAGYLGTPDRVPSQETSSI